MTGALSFLAAVAGVSALIAWIGALGAAPTPLELVIAAAIMSTIVALVPLLVFVPSARRA